MCNQWHTDTSPTISAKSCVRLTRFVLSITECDLRDATGFFITDQITWRNKKIYAQTRDHIFIIFHFTFKKLTMQKLTENFVLASSSPRLSFSSLSYCFFILAHENHTAILQVKNKISNL